MHDSLNSGRGLLRTRSLEMDLLYKAFNEHFLSPLVERITDDVRIGDYGGGEGIFADDLARMLAMKGVVANIENIDVALGRDVRTYRTRHEHAISRHTLHYLDDWLPFLRNVRANLAPEGYFLLVNWTAGTGAAYACKRRILDDISRMQGVPPRHIPTPEEMAAATDTAGFEAIDVRARTYTLTIGDFYRHRFGLSEAQVELLARRHPPHVETQVSMLLRPTRGPDPQV